MEKQPCAYPLTSKRNGTLYAVVTSDLIKWAWKLKTIEECNPNWRDLYPNLI